MSIREFIMLLSGVLIGVGFMAGSINVVLGDTSSELWIFPVQAVLSGLIILAGGLWAWPRP